MLSLEKASLQAQNALLKLLEEPPANTQIWLTTVSATNLLPTIISRCQEIVMFDTEESAEEPILILDTIEKLSHREISEFAEKYSDREEAAKLVTSLIKQVHKKVASNISKNVLVLQTLLRTKKYIAANVNVRLAVEDGLFTIKRLSQE
jgi:DNA polymerase III delta prime subunit